MYTTKRSDIVLVSVMAQEGTFTVFMVLRQAIQIRYLEYRAHNHGLYAMFGGRD